MKEIKTVMFGVAVAKEFNHILTFYLWSDEHCKDYCVNNRFIIMYEIHS